MEPCQSWSIRRQGRRGAAGCCSSLAWWRCRCSRSSSSARRARRRSGRWRVPRSQSCWSRYETWRGGTTSTSTPNSPPLLNERKIPLAHDLLDAPETHLICSRVESITGAPSSRSSSSSARPCTETGMLPVSQVFWAFMA